MKTTRSGRKVVPAMTIALMIGAGAYTVAEACTGCGCEPKKVKKAETSCESGVCGVTDLKKVHSHDHGGHHGHAHNLTTVQMVKKVDEASAIILDARSGKWDDGERIPGAKQLSSNASAEEISALLPEKSAKIITYCSNTKCPASKQLADKLVKMGYSNVMEYPEGIAGWKAAGGSVEQANK